MTSALKDMMVTTYISTGHLVKSIDQVTVAVSEATEDKPLIVDLDETLFLRNATQEYLGSIYPKPLGAVFLIGAKLLKPWHWLPTKSASNAILQDWFLVVAATILFPWTWLVWRWRTKKLAEQYCNMPLAQTIDTNPKAQVVIVTKGFDFIVNPLVRHFPLLSIKNNNFKVISSRFWQWKGSNFAGTLEMVDAVLGKAAVSRSIVVTDSEEDLPLLEASATPCLLKWPEAAFVPAMADMYIPLFYSEKIKNPGKAHFIRQVISSHWMFGVIAWSTLSPHPALNAASLLFLTLSYWCVYEIGYQENDTIGEKYEHKPTLSSTYEQYKSRIDLSTPWPWCWSLAFAIPGIFMFALSQQTAPLAEAISQISVVNGALVPSTVERIVGQDLIVWLAYLGAIRATFWIYNQANETSRIWLYPLLPAQRLFGFSLLASTNVIGSMLLIAYVVARWVRYCIYRCGGDPKFPVNISCFLLLILLYSALAVGSADVMSLMTWQAGIAFAYCALRSAKKIYRISPQLGWLKDSRA